MTKMNLMLFRMIKNSKSQFIAVSVIIVAGICIYTSMGMVAENLFRTVDSYYQETRFPHVFVQAMGVPVQEIERLRQIDGVSEAAGSLILDVPVLSHKTERRKTLRLVTESSDNALSKSALVEGRLPQDAGKEILLIDQYARANDIAPGEEIRVQVSGISHTLNVVGIAANPEYIYMVENVQSIMPDESNFGVCFIPEATGRMIMGESQNYNYIRVEYESGIDDKSVIEALEERLKPYGLQSIVEREDQLSNAIVLAKLENIGQMADYLPILFLAIAGFILVMIISRIVKNDRLKIGVLKAMGYHDRQILFHYIKYAIVAGLMGGFLGVILGVALANAMTELFLEYFNLPMLKFQFDISYIFSAILLTSAFCAISGLFGSRGVIKITPADAMREEPPKSGKRIMLERLTPVWKRISFSRKLVLKNIFRNKKRTTFVILGVAITYAMMLFATTMPAVVDQMMNQHFTEFQKMDYNIDFYRPVGEKTVRDLKHIIDVDYAEGKIDFPFELSRGHRKQSVNIIGLTEDTHFYEFTDSSGKPQPIRSGGIILSENLSRILKAKKGDSVQVTSYLTEKRKMLIPVIGVVKQTLGMNAYMEIGEMRDILLEKGVITGVYVNTRDEAVSEKLLAATNIAATMSTRDMRAIYEEYMDIIFASIGFMLVFAGIIGFCIVYIATMISINEREGEFSSLRVLGFTKTEIFRMVRRENNIITAAGILFGIPIGQLFCRYSTVAFSTDIYTLDISPALTEGIWSGIFTIGFVVLAQAATYRKIRGLDFLQALKNRAG